MTIENGVPVTGTAGAAQPGGGESADATGFAVSAALSNVLARVSHDFRELTETVEQEARRARDEAAAELDRARRQAEDEIRRAREEAAAEVDSARRQAADILAKARDEASRVRQDLDSMRAELRTRVVALSETLSTASASLVRFLEAELGVPAEP